MKEIDLDKIFKAELINIEQDNDKLKIVFKITANEPLLFNFNNNVVAITEIYDIYELDLLVFPAITLRYWIKNVGTGDNPPLLAEYFIDLNALGFYNYDEFKQFIIKYPMFVRYLEFIYNILYAHPHLSLLYASTMMHKHNVKIDNNEIKIMVEKIQINTIIKEFEINEKITFKLLNKDDNVLLTIGNMSIADFGSAITYKDISKILEERPNAILNTLILLILTLLF
jgi:hypothetical protein